MEQYLATQTGQIPILGFLINLLLTAALCYLLGRLYVFYGGAPSNRRAFARNFVMLGTTTMVIITVVKSSLALSLGLVGALSIVRFRAAIKDPEELTFLFLTISIGLGLGADQRLITLLAFAVIAIIIIIKRRIEHGDQARHVHLTVSTPERAGLGLSAIVGVLEKHCTELSLSRFDEGGQQLEAAFAVSIDRYSALEAAVAELRALNQAVKVTFLNFEAVGA